MQEIRTYPKLVSVPTLMVLLIAGVAGFMIMSPVPAHAAGPSITLSANTGTPTGSITISGTGFGNGKVITISSAVGSSTVDWFNGDGSGFIGDNFVNSLVNDDTGSLTTTARGDFTTGVTIPEMPGGAQTITVSDGSLSTSATFTVTASLTLTNDNTGNAYSSGYPQQISPVDSEIHGFGASETVTINNNGIFSAYNPTLLTDQFGHATSGPDSATVADASGGSKNVMATGQTSGLTASTPFAITPWVSFYNAQLGNTVFSFLGKAPSSILIEGHGFASGTIAGNSITVGGVATLHSAITVGSSGSFGAGGNNHVVVAPNTDVPFGQVNVVIAGTTFNLANGNINQWNSMGANGPVLGGVLISSIVGTAITTAVGQLDQSGYGFGDSPVALGYGFKPLDVITTNANSQLIGVTLGAATDTIETGTVDANGAIFLTTTSGSFGDLAAGSYTDTFTGSTTANTINPSFNVHQVLTMNFDTTNDVGIEASDSGLTYDVHGFTASHSVTVTAGGATLEAFPLTVNGAGAATGVTVYNPDLAGGTYTATASDGTYSATDTFVTTALATQGTLGNSLTVNSGPAGTVTLLRTGAGTLGVGGTAFGVHGLLPSTAYDVNWGMPGTVGSQVLGTFTSTSTGGIPIPGVQITIPTGSAGYHLITIINHATGADALFNNVEDGDRFSAALDNAAGGFLESDSQYGDLIFHETITALALPTVVNVGQTFSLSGSGLFGATTYYTSITTVSGVSSGQLYSQFTTDAAGNIPASTSLVFPAAPALAADCGVGTKYPELATSYYVHLSQGSQFPGGQDGEALVILSGAATTNSSSVPAGHPVTLTGTGLCANQAYNVIFNYVSNGFTFTGQTVSAFVTNTVGSGSAVFTVPAATTPATYTIQLQRLAPTTALGVLNVPPTLAVTGAVTVGCTSTSCFTLSGTPIKTTLGTFTGLDVTYTNTANGPVTGIVYAVVHNSLGQTVYYTTATITPTSGGTATGFLVLSGLPAGTYTVQVFATDTSGNAISTSTSTSVTLP